MEHELQRCQKFWMVNHRLYPDLSLKALQKSERLRMAIKLVDKFKANLCFDDID